MVEPNIGPFRATAKYNPHLWSDDDLRAIFVARTRELGEIIEKIRAVPPDGVPQHLLVTGQRGMGKTTLLRRIALAVADDAELSRHWIALTFPEEQYTVSNPAELWSNVLDALADTLEREGVAAPELARLDAAVARMAAQPPREREESALAWLDEWVKQNGRRILLLIDSTDLLFSGLGMAESGGRGKRGADAGATALWRLRKTLSHDPSIFWLGASYQALEASHQYSDAFHDFFEILELRPLSVADMRGSMIALARSFGAGGEGPGDAAAAAMTRTLDARPERLKTLRAITGGNPRTTVILYDLFAAGWQDDLHTDLKVLLDAMSPLYKSRMELLAEQPRKLLAHLMEHWAPMGAKELAEVSGIPNTTVSGQLARLEAEGLVEKAKLKGTRRAGFQVAERFFNIWYLMRYTSRRVRQRLTWLVEFMRLWYSGEELRSFAQSRIRRHADGRLSGGEQLEYSLALATALGDGCRERHQLEYAVFSSAWRVAEQQRRSLAEAFPELFDLEGQDKPFRSAEDYLRRFKALDEKLERCPHAKTAEEKRAWVEAVKGSLTLSLEEKERVAEGAETLSKAAYLNLKAAFSDERQTFKEDKDTYDHVFNATLKGEFFPDCPDSELTYRQIIVCFGEDAKAVRLCVGMMQRIHADQWGEAACRKAIELDPKEPYPWYGLGNLLQYHLGRYEEAEAAYKKAIKLDSKYAGPWYGLGRVLHYQFGRFIEAEIAYRKAISLDPKFTASWSHLGRLLQFHLHRYAEAEIAYRKTIDFDSQHPYPIANLAYLLAQTGQIEAASEEYLKVIYLVDKNTGTGYDLLRLQAYLWLKDFEASRLALDRLAQAANNGNVEILYGLRAQTRECQTIGLGPALADLMANSAYADFLRPMELALRAANGDPEALDGVPPEVRSMAEEVLAEIKRTETVAEPQSDG